MINSDTLRHAVLLHNTHPQSGVSLFAIDFGGRRTTQSQMVRTNWPTTSNLIAEVEITEEREWGAECSA